MNKSCDRFLVVFAFGVCVFLVALLLGTPLSGQSTSGTISGTVSDASGSAVPDATVTLTNEGTDA